MYVELDDPGPRDAVLAVPQFEARVSEREPRRLISGLTERLVESGADPEDVIDEEAVIEEIDHLQELARTEPRRRGWRRWARRRDDRSPPQA